jgi:hypothetical protein
MKLPGEPKRSGAIGITVTASGEIRAHGCRRIAPPCPYTEASTFVIRLGRNYFAPDADTVQLQGSVNAYLTAHPDVRVLTVEESIAQRGSR